LRYGHRSPEKIGSSPICGDLNGVRVIAVDEFAIRKGHRCTTVVVERYRKRVLWLGLGRGRQDVRPFFELLASAPLKIDLLTLAALYYHPDLDVARALMHSEPGVAGMLMSGG
jgi:hypothetical protein